MDTPQLAPNAKSQYFDMGATGFRIGFSLFIVPLAISSIIGLVKGVQALSVYTPSGDALAASYAHNLFVRNISSGILGLIIIGYFVRLIWRTKTLQKTDGLRAFLGGLVFGFGAMVVFFVILSLFGVVILNGIFGVSLY